ncbi:MAG: DUF6876 family protein [Cyanobacteria bacterium P01_E01_bin.6]
MTSSRHDLTESDLARFTGSDVIYKHPVFNIRYTEGVQYMAEHAGAYWLIEAIASWQFEPQVREDPMLQEIQFWALTVNDDSSAVLVCERDTDDVVVTQSIAMTDFPLRSIKLYFQQGVLLLPSEY